MKVAGIDMLYIMAPESNCPPAQPSRSIPIITALCSSTASARRSGAHLHSLPRYAALSSRFHAGWRAEASDPIFCGPRGYRPADDSVRSPQTLLRVFLPLIMATDRCDLSRETLCRNRETGIVLLPDQGLRRHAPQHCRPLSHSGLGRPANRARGELGRQ